MSQGDGAGKGPGGPDLPVGSSAPGEPIGDHAPGTAPASPTWTGPDGADDRGPTPDPVWADLAAQRPGHGVLAHIAARLRAEAAQPGGGAPARLAQELWPWAVGFVGEERVGLELALLDPGWRVLHSVPVGRNGGDIDHLVIGPPGIFTINTKHHSGARIDVRGDGIFLGRDAKPYARKVQAEAALVRATLLAHPSIDCPVTPIVCTVGASLQHQATTQGFWIMEDDRLVSALRDLGRVLTAEQVEWLYEQARRSTTWTEGSPVAAAPPEVAVHARRLAAAAIAGRVQAKPVTGQVAAVPAPTRAQGAAPPRKRSSTSPAVPTARVGGTSGRPATPPTGRRLLLALAMALALMMAIPLVVGQTATVVGGALGLPADDPAGVELDSPYRASDDLPYATPGASCRTADDTARTFVGNHLLQCQGAVGPGLSWQYANPMRRLPTALPGTRCATLGEHARDFGNAEVALVCAEAASGPPHWTPDPEWTPPA